MKTGISDDKGIWEREAQSCPCVCVHVVSGLENFWNLCLGGTGRLRKGIHMHLVPTVFQVLNRQFTLSE